MKFLILPPLLAFSLSSAISLAADKGGNGGNPIAVEFRNRFESVLTEIAAQKPDLLRKIPKSGISRFRTSSRIIVVVRNLKAKNADETQDSVALNFPDEMKILINEKRWLAIHDDRVKDAIVLHEVLGLMRLERTGDYHLSSEYATLVGLPDALVSTYGTNLICDYSKDGRELFRGTVKLTGTPGEGEGAGAALLIGDGDLKVFVEEYPLMLTANWSRNGITSRVQTGKLTFWSHTDGSKSQSTEIEVTNEENRYTVKCQDSPKLGKKLLVIQGTEDALK